MSTVPLPDAAMRIDAVVLRELQFAVGDELVRGQPLRAPTFMLVADSRMDTVGRTLEVDLTLKPQVGQTPAPAFTVSMRLTGRFSWTGDLPFAVKEFADGNALVILWPFAREVIAGVTAKAGLPAFLLPLVNVSKAVTDARAAAGAGSVEETALPDSSRSPAP